MMNDERILDAIDFAGKAHLGQTRKMTGEPYIFHPVEVGQLVYAITKNVTATIAAILHDTIEDTDVTPDDVLKAFGPEVLHLVMSVTKTTKLADGVRAVRKEIDRKHYSNGGMLAQSIKLADVISNLGDIKTQEDSFVKVYVPEQKALVESLTLGHPNLIDLANRCVEAASAYAASLK